MTGDMYRHLQEFVQFIGEDETIFDYNEETIKEQMLIESFSVKFISMTKEGHYLEQALLYV